MTGISSSSWRVRVRRNGAGYHGVRERLRRNNGPLIATVVSTAVITFSIVRLPHCTALFPYFTQLIGTVVESLFVQDAFFNFYTKSRTILVS